MLRVTDWTSDDDDELQTHRSLTHWMPSTPTMGGRGATRLKTQYPCGHCMEETSKAQATSVPCSICENWFHQKCVQGMTTEFVESCHAMMRIEGKSSLICFCCRSKVEKHAAFVKEVRQEMKDVTKEMQDVAKEMQEMM